LLRALRPQASSRGIGTVLTKPRQEMKGQIGEDASGAFLSEFTVSIRIWELWPWFSRRHATVQASHPMHRSGLQLDHTA
jgi:hypothetical protein